MHATVEAAPAAVVFDLDGVVTFTAQVHFASWKALFDPWLRDRSPGSAAPVRAFEAEDYQRFVDGRPRTDGAREFLASRGITVPLGDPSDPPDRETLWGLGHRKNAHFQRLLQEQGVDVDAEAVRLIRELRAAGIRVGMASSSRNAEAVLQRAGLLSLFEARTDGVLSERAGLRGKPFPDIYHHCLRQLGGIDPSHAIVVEDAAAGVEAGRAGGFGLVVGVDRGGNGMRLREAGADWIVRSFEGLSEQDVSSRFAARVHRRPNVLAAWPEVRRPLDRRPLALFLDYDGTLTPIVDRPERARLSDAMRAAVSACADAWPTVIVSGRGREDVAALVGLENLTYAGSHGFDVAGPAGSNLRLEVDRGIVPLMDETAAEARARTRDIPGVLVEHKRFSVAVHYRLTQPDQVAAVSAVVDDLASRDGRLRKTHGKMVFELRPARDWDKGRAVLWLLDALGLDTPDVVPIFIGDDTTDEDAFRAIAGRGIGIVVMDIPRPTAAHYAVQDVEEVRALLERLAEPHGAGT